MSSSPLLTTPSRLLAVTRPHWLHHLATASGTIALVWMAALAWGRVPLPFTQGTDAAPLHALQGWWVNAGLLGLVALAFKMALHSSAGTDAQVRPGKLGTVLMVLGSALFGISALMWGVGQAARPSAAALVADYTWLTQAAPLVATSPTDADFDGQGHLVPQVKADRCARAAMGLELFRAHHLSSPQAPMLGLAAVVYQGLNARAVKAGCIDVATGRQRARQVQSLVTQAQHTPKVQDALWVGVWGGRADQIVLAQAKEVLERPLP